MKKNDLKKILKNHSKIALKHFFSCFPKNLFEKIKSSILSFFKNYPFLFIALFFSIGISFYFFKSAIFFIFLILIKNKKSLLFAILAFFIGFFFSFSSSKDLKKIDSQVNGEALFKINSIKQEYNFGSKYYVYKGNIISFITKDKIYKNIKASIFAKKKYDANFLYFIESDLISNQKYLFYLKTKKSWKKSKKVFSFIEMRYSIKKNFSKFLKKIFFDKDSYDFIYTLMTGENTQKLLFFNFSKIGLCHILAVSGFHFGIFILFLSNFLRFFLRKNIVVYLLFFLVNIYFLFLGPITSVLRAYLMIQIALFSQIVNRKYFALNALSIAYIILLIIDPLNILNAGFQLSFACSFAILFGFNSLNSFFDRFIKKRGEKELQDLNFISKLGDRLFNFIRLSFCLSIAVSIFILPIVLYHFKKFSIISLVYNIFFPPLVGICMISVILGMIFLILIPPVGKFINYFNIIFTKFLLNLITYSPAKLHFFIRSNTFSFEKTLFLLFIIFLSFLTLKSCFLKKQDQEFFKYL